MEVVNIKGTDDTPKVILDKSNSLFEISGRSLPEDVNMFYEPILKWIEQYTEQPNSETIFNFKLEYFNTASSKVILDIMLKLEEIHEAGNKVIVRWHHRDDEEDMLEAGEEYADIVAIPFEYVVY